MIPTPPGRRKRDIKKLLGQIAAEIHQFRAIPRSDHTRKEERELLQERIDDKDLALRMLQDELYILSDD